MTKQSYLGDATRAIVFADIEADIAVGGPVADLELVKAIVEVLQRHPERSIFIVAHLLACIADVGMPVMMMASLTK